MSPGPRRPKARSLRSVGARRTSAPRDRRRRPDPRDGRIGRFHSRPGPPLRGPIGGISGRRRRRDRRPRPHRRLPERRPRASRLRRTARPEGRARPAGQGRGRGGHIRRGRRPGGGRGTALRRSRPPDELRMRMGVKVGESFSWRRSRDDHWRRNRGSVPMRTLSSRSPFPPRPDRPPSPASCFVRLRHVPPLSGDEG